MKQGISALLDLLIREKPCHNVSAHVSMFKLFETLQKSETCPARPTLTAIIRVTINPFSGQCRFHA
jgi:hypothetical protein